MKQLGLSLHNYHDAHSAFPPGVQWPGGMYAFPRTGFAVLLMPYLEQSPLYNQYNFTSGSLSWYFANSATVTPVVIPTWRCPSDIAVNAVSLNTGSPGGVRIYSVGNYMGMAGQVVNDMLTKTTYPFRANASVKIRDAVDGTSNTVFMAEYVASVNANGDGSTADFRGILWTDQEGRPFVWCLNPPNSTLPDVMYPNQCENKPLMNRPCTTSSDATQRTVASRSMHVGGVTVLLGDGSVRFVSQNINLLTWQGLATTSGAEVLGEF
jgi:hypothetical protein